MPPWPSAALRFTGGAVVRLRGDRLGGRAMARSRGGATVTALGLAAAGFGLVVAGLPGTTPPQPRAPVGVLPVGALVTRAAPDGLAGPAAPVAPAAAATGSTPPVGLPRSAAVRVEIPAIGVSAAVLPVGRDARGAIDVPAPTRQAAATAYWYDDLAAPGQVGPTVIVGHVDSARDGPAVFFRLGELPAGSVVTVRRADGVPVRYLVRAVARFAKAAFPDAAVYGPTAGPTLRLITCGGDFDPARGSYRDNVVVFATLDVG